MIPTREHEVGVATSDRVPYNLLRDGALAQLGERLNGIQEVSGSIPLSSTKRKSARFKLKRALFVCVVQAFIKIALHEPRA